MNDLTGSPVWRRGRRQRRIRRVWGEPYGKMTSISPREDEPWSEIAIERLERYVHWLDRRIQMIRDLSDDAEYVGEMQCEVEARQEWARSCIEVYQTEAIEVPL